MIDKEYLEKYFDESDFRNIDEQTEKEILKSIHYNSFLLNKQIQNLKINIKNKIKEILK